MDVAATVPHPARDLEGSCVDGAPGARKPPGPSTAVAGLGYGRPVRESEETVPVKIGNVLHPVADVDAAVRFYADVFGLAAKFVDGDRYAALDAGGTTLALAGPAEDVTGGVAAASFKVPDVAAALAELVRAGGSVLRDPERGPHEVRAVARDPWGNTVVVYGPH
jgi:predicted enzyme related to lactoylglutathione lyase